MLRIARAGLRGHAVRLVLTGLAVALGVGFLAGTLVYGDTATAAFYNDLARSARGVDVAVLPPSEQARLPVSTVDRIRAVPGVTTVDGRIEEELPLLAPDGRLIAGGEKVGVALSPPGDSRLAAFDVAAGRLPAAPGEIAVDRTTVDRYGFALGGPVRALDRDGRAYPLVLVGVLDLGVNRRYLGRSVAVVADQTPDGYAEIVVAGQDPAGLRDRVRAVAGDARVLTGAELRRELATEAAKYVEGFGWVLVAFGLVALAVCGFVIHNTFAILAAQRSRELALLRCLGASRRQVAGAIGLEALALGTVGSVAGLVASALVGAGLIEARETVGAAVPAHAPVVAGRTVAVALGVGILVTVLSALGPAIRSGRVPPLAALRDADAWRPGRRRTVRFGLAALLLGGGSALAAASVPRGFGGLPLVVGGAIVAFLGLVAAAPLAVGRLVGALGRLVGALGRLGGALGRLGAGPVARLATGNAHRNPYRTAGVAMALLIGVALMSMLSVLLATARTQAGRELTENFPVDFVVTRLRFGDDPVLPPDLAGTLRRTGAFASVTGVRTHIGWAPDPDRLVTVWAVEPGGQARPEVSDGTLDGPADGQMALGRRLAWQAGVSVGDPFTVSGVTRRVVALYDDTPVAADALVSWTDFTAAYGPGGADRLLISGGSAIALDAALRDQPLVRVQTPADARAQLGGAIDELLAIFGALLSFSVVIAVFGITNTLTLSTLERSRETATLWALGLSRRRLRGMLLVEAALMATVGAAGGVAFGVGVGWVAASGLIRAYGHGAPTVPVGQLMAFTALAVAAALLAAVLPARRAARATASDLN